jgi:hypothetical protein
LVAPPGWIVAKAVLELIAAAASMWLGSSTRGETDVQCWNSSKAKRNVGLPLALV